MLGYEEADELKIIKMVIAVPVVVVFSLLVLDFDKIIGRRRKRVLG